MAYLQFEAMDIDKVKTKRSVAYIDHNNKTITVTNKSKNKEYKMNLEISPRQRELLKSGGLLNHMKNREMAK